MRKATNNARRAIKREQATRPGWRVTEDNWVAPPFTCRALHRKA